MELTIALATILKKYRLNLNISQEELSFRSNLDRTYISMLERGKRKPTLEVIFKLCNALEVASNKFIKDIENIL